MPTSSRSCPTGATIKVFAVLAHCSSLANRLNTNAGPTMEQTSADTRQWAVSLRQALVERYHQLGSRGALPAHGDHTALQIFPARAVAPLHQPCDPFADPCARSPASTIHSTSAAGRQFRAPVRHAARITMLPGLEMLLARNAGSAVLLVLSSRWPQTPCRTMCASGRPFKKRSG